MEVMELVYGHGLSRAVYKNYIRLWV